MVCLGGRISNMNSNKVDYISRDFPYGLDEKHHVGNSSNLENTLRSLKDDIMNYKVDNERIMQEHEKQAKVKVIIL